MLIQTILITQNLVNTAILSKVLRYKKNVKNYVLSAVGKMKNRKSIGKVYKKLRSSIWHETDEFIGKLSIMQYLAKL